MDPAELRDCRADDSPVALWRNMIVLSVHSDTPGAVPKEWKSLMQRLVHDFVFRSAGTQTMAIPDVARDCTTQS
jgi:hypothetical protein